MRLGALGVMVKGWSVSRGYAQGIGHETIDSAWARSDGGGDARIHATLTAWVVAGGLRRGGLPRGTRAGVWHGWSPKQQGGR